jgi:hypothetical protein
MVDVPRPCQDAPRMWLDLVRAVLGLVLAFSACAACGGSAESKSPRQGPVSTLVGHVRLVGGTALPEYTALDLVRTPLQRRDMGELPSECARANEDARTPVQLTASGFLSGVVVAASDFTRVREHKAKHHKLVIEHCRLKPALLAATGGDILELENHDEFDFAPIYGPAYTPVPLRRGKRIEQVLIPGGVDSMLCTLGAPCGRSDIIVFFHPVHAVTDAEGAFKISNFPASELVRVSAWHPLFEPAETLVWLEPGQTSHVELALTPKERFVPKPDARAELPK